MAERKKVAISGKPSRSKPAPAIDAVEEWVTQAPASAVETPAVMAEPVEPMKRLTIDVPASLHSRIKVQCAQDGLKMADVIRALLGQHFPERPKR